MPAQPLFTAAAATTGRSLPVVLARRAVTALLLMTAAATASAMTADQATVLFDAVLAEHVSDGSVDYDGVAADGRYADFVDWLAGADPEALEGEATQLAFWINAYNALSIKGILDGGSPSSLFGRARFFKSRRYTVGGRALTLDEIEKKIIIPYGEPRIHFAIVCSSASCPKLQSAAYTAAELDGQLDSAAREFLNDRSKNYYDSDAGRLYLSKIFDWFEDDFTAAAGSVPAYVAAYLEDPAEREAVGSGSPSVRYLRYDWSLNGSFSGG